MSIGGLIKHLKLMNEEELKHLNKMLFKVFFCIMLFYNIYLTDFHQSFQPDLIAFCVMAVILTCAIVTFTMAQQMDSDGELAGNCVIFTSALSCFTLFGWTFLTKTLGLF